MATARRLTAAETIRSLQVDEFDNSCDEDEDTTAQSVMQATYENSDLSDCDSDELNETGTQLDKKRIFTSATVIKEMCGYRPAKSDLLPLSTMVAESSSQTS